MACTVPSMLKRTMLRPPAKASLRPPGGSSSTEPRGTAWDMACTSLSTAIISGCWQPVVLEHVAQPVLLHLAGRTQRDAVDEDNVIGRPPLGDLAVVEPDQLFAGHLGARLPRHHEQRPLVPLGMVGADACGHRDCGVRHRDA